MATPRLAAGALALAALVLAALPLAAAASAEGAFRAPAATLGAPVAFDAASAQLRWAGDGAPLLDATVATVHVERIGVRAQSVGTLVGADTQPFTQSAHHGDASLGLVAGDGADALVALRSEGALLAELGEAKVRPVDHATVARARPGHVCMQYDLLCWEAVGATEVRSDRALVQVPGEVRLMLHGPTLVVRDAQGEHRYTSGVLVREEGAVRTQEDAWLLVTVTGAAGTLLVEGDVATYAPALTLGTSAATLDAAHGRLDDGLRAYVAKGERVDVTGDLRVVPGPVTGQRNANDGRDVTYGEGFDVALQGDVEAVSLSAMPLYQSSPGAVAGIAALVVAGSALAYAWPLVQFHATSAMLPLYTRLKPPQLLDNRVRNAIFEIIRGNPGISARSIHRLSDQSWGTVVYHLRQLEKHDLVVSRSVGRTRNYYENHGKYRGMEVQLACLRSERARVLARLVLTTPGIAQEELVTRSTFPQPTTSYYVRKLKSAGLVEERRDGRYARYHPVGDVARFLELAESDPAPTPA